MRKYKICVIKGDGIGPEVVEAALDVVSILPLRFSFSFAEAGFGAYKQYGTPLPSETIEKAKDAEAVFFGAVTTPANIKGYKSPIVSLRKIFDLYINLRPIFSFKNPKINFYIIRENTEGLYVGDEEEYNDRVVSKRVLTRKGCARILRFAFSFAKSKGMKLTVVHKANVIRKGDGMFLQIAKEVSKEFPEVEWEDMLVDSCAYRIVKKPEEFGVIVTTNMFGDILSDLAAGLTEGLGVLPSANLGENKGLFEPVHGSAPKYAGLDRANPTAAILSFSLLLDYLGEKDHSEAIMKAVDNVVKQGKTTKDLGGNLKASEFVNEVKRELKKLV